MKVGSDFSGVGAFDFALGRIIPFETVFACDMDKYARQSYIANHGEPGYYPLNVYDREIPKESLDIYMTSPPCQSFSLAGKREGKNSAKGILFFNSHEFIQVNKPRFFIFENVKGLLSDDNGRTFQEWVNMLGGKSVNGLPILFPYENSVPYHLYWQVLNSKKHGVPQNRERVFLVGIRDDCDNSFQFPTEEYLTRRLKDVLENEVDEKYFLSDKSVKQLTENGIDTDYLMPNEVSNTLRCGGGQSLTRKHTFDMIKIIGNTNPSGNGMNGNVFDEEGISPTLSTNKGEGIKVKCIPVLTPDRVEKRQNGRRFKEDGEEMFTITTQDRHGVYNGYRIRRLTPRECFRLQDFPDTFKFVVSDSQLYKQAGNSITVRVLEKILCALLL